MGIPSYFSHIIRNYSNIIRSLKHFDEQKIRNQNSKEFLPSPQETITQGCSSQATQPQAKDHRRRLLTFSDAPIQDRGKISKVTPARHSKSHSR
jgi:hypothetical protein